MLGGSVAVVGGVAAATVTASNLTSGRVVVAGTAGLLGDDADLTFATDTLTAAKISTGQLTDTGLTSGRVPIAGTGGLLGDDAGLTFAAGTLSATNLTSSGTVSAGVAAGAAFTPGAWTPTFACSGSMTYTSTSIAYSKYCKWGKTVWFSLQVSGTTGGTASTQIYFTLPVTAASSSPAFWMFVAGGGDGGNLILLSANLNSTQGFVDKLSNWGLGAARTFNVTGIYEAAA
jgi:hypothetical protein